MKNINKWEIDFDERWKPCYIGQVGEGGAEVSGYIKDFIRSSIERARREGVEKERNLWCVAVQSALFYGTDLKTVRNHLKGMLQEFPLHGEKLIEKIRSEERQRVVEMIEDDGDLREYLRNPLCTGIRNRLEYLLSELQSKLKEDK